MKRLKKDLESVIKNLKALTQKTQKMSKELARLEKAMAKPKAKRRPAKKAAARKKAPARKKAAVKKAKKKVTATDTVLNIISRSKRGVNTAALKKKTGYNDAKVRSIVFRLKKAGKIKAPSKGLYVKA